MKTRLFLITIACMFTTGLGVHAESATEADQAEGEASSKSLFESFKDNEKVRELASQIDFSKLTWKDISSVPYSDKDALVAWASTQVKTWQEQLKDAGVKKGTTMMDNLGDTGWQGALKKVKESIEAVEKSSPETYEAARNGLVSSWNVFTEQAARIIGS